MDKDYQQLEIEGLHRRIDELETLVAQLLAERETKDASDFAWSGNLGHWYWNCQTNLVNFNKLKALALGYEELEIPQRVGHEFFTEKLHPEDYEATMDAMRQLIQGNSPVYEVEYRIRTKDGNWKWFYDRGAITQRTQKGKPKLITGIVFDITQRKELEAKLQAQNKLLFELSMKDGLTKLYNHRTIFQMLEEAVASSLEDKSSISILMLDLDNFKRLNDDYGHQFGDEVLKQVAAAIRENLKEGDFAGRYGGEEFLVVFPGRTLAEAKKGAEDIRQAIQALTFSKNVIVTISGGVTQFAGTSVMMFIDKADRCMYKAKNSGKNKIVSCQELVAKSREP